MKPFFAINLLSMVGLFSMMGCNSIWISPSEYKTIMSAGNGTRYFNMAYTNGDPPFWEFYDDQYTYDNDEEYLNAFETFLQPQHPWAFTFLMVHPPQTERYDNEYYYLFGKMDTFMGVRPTDTGLELSLFFHPGSIPTSLHTILSDVTFDHNQIWTVQYTPNESIECTQWTGGTLEIFIDGEMVAQSNNTSIADGFEGCDFMDNSPVTFGWGSYFPSNTLGSGMSFDDLSILEGELSDTALSSIIEQILNPPEADLTGWPNYDLPVEGMMWHTVDAFNGDYTIGFLDPQSRINASWRYFENGKIVDSAK